MDVTVHHLNYWNKSIYTSFENYLKAWFILFNVMLKPTLKEFKEKSKQGNLIPVYKEVLADLDTPVSAYMKMCGGEYSFLLESVEGGEKWARYCFLGFDPSIIISIKGNEVVVEKMVKQNQL